MTLPPPTTDVPSMAKYPFYSSYPGNSSESFQCSREGESVGFAYPPSYSPATGPFPDRRISSSPSILTPSPGASDGLSPSLSSVNTGSSQGSQAPGNMYSYVSTAWTAPNNSSYTVSSATQAQPTLGQQHFGGRTHPIYNQGPGMHQYNHPRSSQSPATGGDGLPAPPYDQVNQPFQTSISGGGGQTTPPGLTTSQHAQGGILTSQSSIATQPPTPSSVSAHVDSYTHSRPPSTPNYYTSSATQPPSYPPYGHQPSPTQHTSSNGGPVPRGLGSMSGPHGVGMAPPAPYRSYTSYQPLPTMGGSVLSNIHQPGSQMSMIPGIKDALKRHRLVKGCENKSNENTGDGNGADRSGEENDSPDVKRE
ncbi:uncharacterized protein FTJAE_6121 [Fusarium tjaetaba]|uniref:Uncharacterized protein n=1 Tax=Fusarium tjaetaba TaxID=1567544 RepID=A0A8H5RMS0_9HYPO|nr:uncharacterized protein FTJAE_6121 [Fusarium tjaetaba]KAF5636354.1 hypothetical protein FTJAE_6121 [Fusarium tjaetaba]